jgi:hypothetical protein
MSTIETVTPDDVRAFAARVCAVNVTLSPVDQEEYERLRSKLFAACRDDPRGIDRIAAVTNAAKACLTPGRIGDGRTIARFRNAVTALINHFA